jgi:polysaccharide export outer membrane protein
MRFTTLLSGLFAAAMAALVGSAPAGLAQEAYPLGPGDKLSFIFLSKPEFDRTVVIGVDGSVFVPLLGEINVQGQTINRLREQIPRLMTGSVYRERINGEYLLVTIEPSEVLVDIAEYRPIYVEGSVRSPGRQAFEVGMTARQAIAAAGGLDPVSTSTNAQLDIRDHPEVLMAELVGVLAEMAVHEAILKGVETLDVSEIEKLNAPEELTARAIQLAKDQVETASAILREEIDFLDESVKEAESGIIAALRHEEAMTEIVTTEEAELRRIEDLVARRIVRSDALTQARRLYLAAVDRLGSVQAERIAAEAARRELVLKRNQALRERALKTQERLQHLAQQASQLRARISLSTAVPLTSTKAGEEASQNSGLRIVVFRQTDGQSREIDAREGTLLSPGDVVTVSLGH